MKFGSTKYYKHFWTSLSISNNNNGHFTRRIQVPASRKAQREMKPTLNFGIYLPILPHECSASQSPFPVVLPTLIRISVQLNAGRSTSNFRRHTNSSNRIKSFCVFMCSEVTVNTTNPR
jgi:hypothetical protein